MNFAEFRCLNCGFEWTSEPGPTSCFKCNHLYVKWVNYEEWRENASEEYKRHISGKGKDEE